MRLFHSGDRVKKVVKYKYHESISGYKPVYRYGKVLGTVHYGFDDETVEWYLVLWSGRKTAEETGLDEHNRV